MTGTYNGLTLIRGGSEPLRRVRRAERRVTNWGEAIDGWMVSMRAAGFSPHTLKRRRSSIATLTRAVDRPLEAVKRTDVEGWLAGFDGARTRQAYWSDARSFFRWVAETNGTADPTVGVRRPRTPKSLPRPIPMRDIRRALQAAPEPVRTWILCGALAGLRVGEIAALHRDDVEQGVIIVRGGKGDKDRAVPVHPALAGALRGEGWVAPGPNGPLSAGQVSRRISAVFREVGIDATPHALRHSFGTEMARSSGGDLVTLGALMGHVSMTTTMNYVKASAARQREVVTSLRFSPVDEPLEHGDDAA